MLLRSIEIQGFKSFADKTVLKFGRGITAIVGPNGSGKSNISDAVRWVLGEQSTKSLRGQSMEDVIFGGTASRRPHGYCEVTLVIDNTDRQLQFDGDTVAVTRRYYRSHESEYQINRVSVRLKDVHELFMDTGLGRDGYSMIGQGKIDTIIGSKSQERRDIFEEAAGISRYRYRKQEAERKLEAAEENLVRLNDILQELEGRVGPLKEQSRKAEQFLELSDRKRELEIGLWLDTLQGAKETLRAQESKIAACQAQYGEIESSLADFEKQIEENSARFADYTTRIEAQRAAAAELEESATKAEGQIAVLENTLLHNGEAADRLRQEIEQLAGSDVTAQAQIEEKLAEADARRADGEALAAKISETEAALTGLLSDSEHISRQIEEQVRRLNLLSAGSADARVQMVTAQSTIGEIEARRGTVAALIEQHTKEAETLAAELRETQAMRADLEERLTSCENAGKGYEMRLESRRAKAQELKERFDRLGLEIESKSHRAQTLEDLEKNMEGFPFSVKAVLQKANDGALRGVCGPVSRLIQVEPKHTVAIETALGAAMQNIIVESETDAKRAIGYLKSANQGRATFLPIRSMKGRALREGAPTDCDGYVGVAADLVECDPKYREIIRYLLGTTVVAEEIDAAVAMTKRYQYRFKVVTLDGQVVNAGGSLTGGSLAKNAGLLSRGGEVKRLRAEVEKLKEQREEANAALNEAKAAEAAVEADLLALRAEQTTAAEDKIRALGEEKRLTELLGAAQKTLADLREESTSAAGKIEQLKTQADAALAKIAALDGEKDAVQRAIDEMSGGRDDLAARREALSDTLTAQKLQAVELQKDVESILSAADTLRAAIGNRAERTTALQAEIEAYGEKDAATRAEIETQRASVAALRKQSAEATADVARLQAARNETEQQGSALRAQERETTARRETVGGELARLSERMEQMQRDHDAVISQLYDEYQLTRSEAEAMGIVLTDIPAAKKELQEIRGKIRGLGNVNVAAIEEYKVVNERYTFLSAQIADVEHSRTELHRLISQLTGQMQTLFLDGFAKINASFTKTFSELFGGGTAELVLTEPDRVLESGIDIHARLPGKNVPSLDGLSGGEKALIALAIYFSIMRINAPPFCFLDEVDTALDDINVERVAEYMRRSDFSTQFICITHRRGTMEAADMLYGVTMQEKGVTKLLELNVAELERKLQLEAR